MFYNLSTCLKFGQLIFRKIIRIVATRCQIFGGKNAQNSTSAGAPPRPHLRSLQRSSDPWLHLRAPVYKGREGKRINEGEKEGRKNELGPQSSLYRSTPLSQTHIVQVLVTVRHKECR